MLFLIRLDKAILQALKIVTITCFVLLTILVSANVFVRFVPVISLHWFDEIIELVYAYLVFYGSAALWITREHFSVGDWLSPRLFGRTAARHAYRIVIEALVLVFALIFFSYSYRLTALAQDVTNVFAIPKGFLYSCMPVAGAIMVVYSVRNIILEILPMVGRGKRRLTNGIEGCR